ncbi:MAG TPA: YciI family protein [Vicinamibacterales bacterium]|nr:YciI family protein [Vicinamibacterales bacterium]
MRELQARGMLRPRGPRRAWLQIAAAVVLVVSGFAIGRLTAAGAGAPPPPGGARYLLLLYGAQSTTAAEETARVREYGAWARAEAAGGRLLTGEKLGDQAAVVGDARGLGSVSLKEPSGFFVIRAATLDEAVATASRCPHIKHGGAVLVRPIE